MDISSETKEHLSTLGFKNQDQIPDVKEIRKTFFKLAKSLHPDKTVNQTDKQRKTNE